MALTRHNLPTAGAWVELRDYTDLRAKHRKQAMAARVGTTEIDPTTGKPMPIRASMAFLAGIDLAESVAAMLITAWHIPYLPGAALPEADPSILGELTMEDNNAILVLTEGARTALLAGAKAIDPSDHEDPDSPSVPASG
jgi:hypothetical protein